MKWLILFLAFLSSDPLGDSIISDTSSHVEINHVYRYNEGDKQYEKRMIQIIWWEWRDSVLLEEKDILGPHIFGKGREYIDTESEGTRDSRELLITF